MSKESLSRRDFMRAAGAAGVGAAVTGGLSPAATLGIAAAQADGALTSEHIAAAQELLGLSFSAEQQAQMLGTVSGRVGLYDQIRSIPLDDNLFPAVDLNVDTGRPPAPAVQRSYNMSPQAELTRPDNLEDAAFYSVTQLAELLRTRQVTSLELTEMYLSRLKRYDPLLQCVTVYTEELAYEQARRADDEISSGDYRGPLHGIPWGAKDLLSKSGYPTTWGATPYTEREINVDATVVERLEAAGAVLIAKLSLGALAFGDVWYGGVTKNPWDTSQGSSGSSAGPAAATAAGLVGFAIGSETLGSIMLPGDRCGVTGFRPSYGTVSRYGAMPVTWSMDKLGPMCRSVEDCALVFSAIYGPDGRDASVRDLPFEWDPALDLGALRVGYVESAFAWDDSSDPPFNPFADPATVANSLRNSAMIPGALRDQGIDLIPIELPPANVFPLFTILFAEAAAARDQMTLDDTVSKLVRQDDGAWPNILRAARFIPAVEYINLNRMRTQVMMQMAAVMQDIDVFVAPSYGSSAMEITNFTGHPQIVLPSGFSDQNKPTSVTFVGGLYKDAEMLAVAKAYQDATDWHQRHPDLAGA